MMTQTASNRSRLLVGCGGAAIALGLVLGAAPARAQAIQASGNIQLGVGDIDETLPGQTTINVASTTMVIDWTPFEDASGNALDFLPTGTTALFQTSANVSVAAPFAVLNRILPSTNGNVAVINGAVISRVASAAGPVPGGTVAFYSPTGILVGSTASFDVGRLLLTTLDTTDTSFQNFHELGTDLQLTGVQGSTARIQILPGAQILASPENAFFAVVAADVEMRGTALVNGSHAYIAGEVVNLGFSNGLFNIFIPVGTAATGEVVTLDGTVGGPSSTGATGDNHMIYGVARAVSDPISMLFSGNLGFEPAQSAGVVNGEIILAANYNVFGRTVDNGNIADGVNAQFRGNTALSDATADIFLNSFTASSSLLAIATRRTQASALNGQSSVAGNLLLVGRQVASLTAGGTGTFTVSGDVLVSAQDYGVTSSSLQSLDIINAQGGTARLEAFSGGTIDIAGQTRVLADAYAGADDLNRVAGTAQGGQAVLGASGGGSVTIGSEALVRSNAFGSSVLDIEQGAVSQAGAAEFFANSGGTLTVDGSVIVAAQAIGARGSSANPSTPSDAFGGQALVSVTDGGGSIFVQGFLEANASASAQGANTSGEGARGDAGVATAFINGPGSIDVRGDLRLIANGQAGDNAGGTGGTGLGGRASAATFGGGTIDVGLRFRADALGFGGSGIDGGAGFGGISGANAVIGAIAIQGDAEAQADGFGGGAQLGIGGTGGNGQGGNAAFQADGTLTETALVSIGGTATVVARGRGGPGGPGAISAGPQGGRGGDGVGGQFALPNQADPAFGSGAFLLAGGDNGRLVVGGSAVADASGFGGAGGDGGIPGGGGAGGDGFGGLAQAGLALLGQDGSLGQGSAEFAALQASADGSGGFGGTSPGVQGIGGAGTGGVSIFTVRAGDAAANQIDLSAAGVGGVGGIGGTGSGGQTGVVGGLGGTLTVGALELRSIAFGGASFEGTGGDALGGNASVDGSDINVTITGDALIDATGSGGGSSDGAGGAATGGTAYVRTVGTGAISVLGLAQIFANASGGNTATAFAAGNATGGLAYADALDGGTIALGSAQFGALAQGGDAGSFEGGDALGGTVRLQAVGAGSTLTIARNVSSEASIESPIGFTMINASGNGGQTLGGDGIGGNGRGGVVEITAAISGSVGLPTDILLDPDRVADTMFVFARGNGGNSGAPGGAGGSALGGSISLLVDEAAMQSGSLTASTFSQGGSSSNGAFNIAGGDATGGLRSIRVINGGTLTIQTEGGGSGAQGGAGSGTGNGGNATAGAVAFEVVGGTANLIGRFSLFNSASGGAGFVGGSAGGGSITAVTQSAQINLSPSTTGEGAIALQNEMFGGAGVDQGGAAVGTAVSLSFVDTQIAGGGLVIDQITTGGSASQDIGQGGNASGATVDLFASGSTLTLAGPLTITASATGGEGASNGTGGTGIGGSVNVTFSDTSLTVLAGGAQQPADIAIRADGIGGISQRIGDSFGGTAVFDIGGSSIAAGNVLLSALATSPASPSLLGGAARGGEARMILSGLSTVAVSDITLDASALTDEGGFARGGTAAFVTAFDSPLSVTAGTLRLLANAAGAAPGDLVNTAGQFFATIEGGDVNLAGLAASALGDAAPGDPPPSQLVADGGNLFVTGNLAAAAFGDLRVRTGRGNVLGSSVAGPTTTAIQLATGGTLEILGDGNPNGGLGGASVNMQAGRSVLVSGNIAARDGAVGIIANAGGGQAFASPAPSVITMAQGTRIDAGTGTVTIQLLDGNGDPQRQSGAITLANVSAGLIDVRNFGFDIGSDIRVLADGVLTASGSGRAIDLAALNGEVINLHGDAGLVLTGSGHFGIYAATPSGSQIGSFANYLRRYNIPESPDYDALDPGGNFAAFRIAPVITVSATDAARFYGSANPAFTASYAGFLPGDGVADLSGAPDLTTLAGLTSATGTYAIDVALGTLLSEQGYQFAIGSPGVLSVTPRPITITADDLSRIYGNANPALTYAVGGLGLVNGDQLTGALATTAGATTGVGNVAITQGTLAASANYALTYNAGVLSINPRPITVTADNLTRIYGNANPVLTYAVGGLGLVNGDQLTGALATTAGATTGVGNVAITQGTLAASANYALTYDAGVLSITPRPITITADNLTRIYGNANPVLTYTVGGLGLVNGDQLTGALATTAGAATGVGNADITQGSLTGGANYTLSYDQGILAITPRPITITASSLAKFLGLPDPALTFAVSGLGLVNGDQITGALVRDAGEQPGNFAIRQGTLGAGGNYATTFVGGQLTINLPPTPPELTTITALAGILAGVETVPSTSDAEQEERFGIDFPDRPDAPLISEDAIVDDPVTSGGDASLYGSGAVLPAGGN